MARLVPNPPLRRSVWTRFRRDQHGGLAAPLALLLPVLMGFTMLAIDGGRYMNLHTSVQAGADALALAGAAELDGRPDALTRADRAVRNLVSNQQRLGEGASAIAGSGVELRFLSGLPAQDGAAIDASYVTADPTLAKFVEVTAQPVEFRSFFAAAAQVTGGPSEARASRAVAGFESIACKASPLFMCNPFERTGTNIFTAMRDPVNRRRLIAMKEKDTKYFPGNFGYLQPAVGTGAGDIRDALGMAEPKGCYKQSGVELRTGAISSTAEAMNTRFDIYEGPMSGAANDDSFRPALNVRKGFKSKNGACTGQAEAYDFDTAPDTIVKDRQKAGKALEAMPAPRDDCFYQSSGCTFGGTAMQGRIGSGQWDIETYWKVTYGTTPPNGWTNADPPSRYEVYRYEIENAAGLAKKAAVGINNSSGNVTEYGSPQCYKKPMPTPAEETVDRRVFYGAILDCQALDERYGISGGSSPPLPVTAFGKFFVTEPVDKKDGTVWVELVDIVEPGTAGAKGIVHDIVRLHR